MTDVESHLQRLDRNLAVARSQVSSLKHHHSLLLSTLLSHPQISTILSDGTASPANSIAQTTVSNHALSHLARAIRASSGLTAFLVEDPDPNARSKNVLGVRIDCVTSTTSSRSNKRTVLDGGVIKRRFGQPCFLFFEILEKESGRVRLHRHTVPGCIALKGLVRKYLGKFGGLENVPTADSETVEDIGGEYDVDEEDDDNTFDESMEAGGPTEQDLHGFVRAVRSEFLSMIKRLEAVSRLREQCMGRKVRIEGAVLEDVVCMDPAARQVELVFSESNDIKEMDDAAGSMRAKISVEKDGKINGVVVRQVDGHGVGRRKRGVERMIMGAGGKGRIDDLSERLIGKLPSPF